MLPKKMYSCITPSEIHSVIPHFIPSKEYEEATKELKIARDAYLNSAESSSGPLLERYTHAARKRDTILNMLIAEQSKAKSELPVALMQLKQTVKSKK